MSRTNKHLNSIQDDDRLADFADQVLEGKIKQAESNADEELLGLEETILRLKRSFPSTSLDQAAVKQMQVRLNARIRRESHDAKQPFWKRWLEPQFRPQLTMGFSFAVLLIALVIYIPSFAIDGSFIAATTLAPIKNILILGVLAGVVLIFLWIKRPK